MWIVTRARAFALAPKFADFLRTRPRMRHWFDDGTGVGQCALARVERDHLLRDALPERFT